MVHTCAVVGCTNRWNRNTERTFHCFPFSDERRVQEWVQRVSRVRPDGKPWTPTRASRVCSDHFVAADYAIDTQQKLLRSTAVPSVFLSYPSHKQPALKPSRRSHRKLPQPVSDREEPNVPAVSKALNLDDHNYCTPPVEVVLERKERELKKAKETIKMLRPDSILKSPVMTEIKIEIDVAEEPGLLWRRLDQSSGDTCDQSEVSSVSTADTQETNTCHPSAAVVKCEPDRPTDRGLDVHTDMVDDKVASGVVHQFQSVDNREEKVDIKQEPSFNADLSSEPVDSCSAVNSRHCEMKSWNDTSEIKTEPSSPSTEAYTNCFVKIERVDVTAMSDERTTAVTASSIDIKAEPVTPNPSSDESSSSDEDQGSHADSEQQVYSKPRSASCQVPECGQKSAAADVCSKTLTSVRNLKRACSGQKSHVCDVCGKIFRRSSHLKTHKMIHAGEKPFACDVCGKAFTQSGNLKAHKLTHAGQKPFACDVCGKIFTQLGNLKTHKMIHAGQTQRPFACDVCGKSFRRLGDLKSHKIIHTGQKPFACDTCGKTFRHSCSLKTHKRIHAGLKPFACDVCGKIFTQSGNLKTHKMIHTGEKPFACEMCGKSFRELSFLKKHRMAHAGQKRFRCDVCSRTFKTAEGLKIHKMLHAGRKSFACDKCSKAFTRLSGLKMHKIIHTGQKPFECDMCCKSFSHPGNLKRHKMVHTHWKPFACDVCGKTFREVCNVKKHMVIHTGQRSFACDLCNKTFTQAGSLNRHKLIIHSGKKSLTCDVGTPAFTCYLPI